MPITDQQLAEERLMSNKLAVSLIGKNYYERKPVEQAAIQRAKQHSVVWIDANGMIHSERRKR